MLNFERNVMLERFEFTVNMNEILLVSGWIHGALRTITSPFFNEFAIFCLGVSIPWSPRNFDGWKAIDVLLDGLANRNPDFRVVFIGSGDWSFITSNLPLVRSRGLLRFQHPHEENRFEKSGVLPLL